MLQKSKLIEAQEVGNYLTRANFLTLYKANTTFRVLENLNTVERIVGYYLAEYGGSYYAYMHWCKLLLKINYDMWSQLTVKECNLIDSTTYILETLYYRSCGRCL